MFNCLLDDLTLIDDILIGWQMGEIVRPNNGSGRDVPAVMRDLGMNDVDDAIQCLELGWIVKEIRVHGCLKTLFVEI